VWAQLPIIAHQNQIHRKLVPWYPHRSLLALKLKLKIYSSLVPLVASVLCNFCFRLPSGCLFCFLFAFVFFARKTCDLNFELIRSIIYIFLPCRVFLGISWLFVFLFSPVIYLFIYESSGIAGSSLLESQFI